MDSDSNASHPCLGSGEIVTPNFHGSFSTFSVSIFKKRLPRRYECILQIPLLVPATSVIGSFLPSLHRPLVDGP